MESKPQRVPLELENPVPNPLPPQSSVVPGTETTAPSATETASGPVDVGEIEEKILAALRSCYDPEIPVNIYELGLVYDIDVSPSGDVVLRMTLTSPACPVAGSLPPEVE